METDKLGSKDETSGERVRLSVVELGVSVKEKPSEGIEGASRI